MEFELQIKVKQSDMTRLKELLPWIEELGIESEPDGNAAWITASNATAADLEALKPAAEAGLTFVAYGLDGIEGENLSHVGIGGRYYSHYTSMQDSALPVVAFDPDTERPSEPGAMPRLREYCRAWKAAQKILMGEGEQRGEKQP